MPFRQLGDAGAQSTVAGAITNSQTTVTLASASGFPAIVQGGQLSVIILDTGNPSYVAASPLATPYEYQQVNGISGNVLTFGPGGGSAARSSYAGTTAKAFFAGATVAEVGLAEDFHASSSWKFDEQVLGTVASVRIPASGSLPASYLGVNFRHIVVEWNAKCDNAANQDLKLQINGDTGGNYNWGIVFNNNSAFNVPSGAGLTNTTYLRAGDVAHTSPAADVSGGRLEILNYANSANYRMYLFQSGIAANTLFQFMTGAGSWNNSANAVTSLLLFSATGNLTAPSIFTTYLFP